MAGPYSGSGEVRAALLERSRLYAGSTPLPPPLAQAALEALRMLRGRPGWRTRLARNTAFLRGLLRRGGVKSGGASRAGGRDSIVRQWSGCRH